MVERGSLPDGSVQAAAIFENSHKRSQWRKTSVDTAAVVSLVVHNRLHGTVPVCGACACLVQDTRTCSIATQLALDTRCNWFREGHIRGSAMKGDSHTVLPSRAFACMYDCEPEHWPEHMPGEASLHRKILSGEH